MTQYTAPELTPGTAPEAKIDRSSGHAVVVSGNRRNALNLGGDETGDSGESLYEGDAAVGLGDLSFEMLLGVERNHATEDDDIDVRGVVRRQHLVELVCCICAKALASQDVRGVKDHAWASADDQNPLGFHEPVSAIQ